MHDTWKELADLCETTISADSSDIQISDITLRSGDVDDGYLLLLSPANGCTVLASPPRPSSKGAASCAHRRDRLTAPPLNSPWTSPRLVVPDVRGHLGSRQCRHLRLPDRHPAGHGHHRDIRQNHQHPISLNPLSGQLDIRWE